MVPINYDINFDLILGFFSNFNKMIKNILRFVSKILIFNLKKMEYCS